jgi:hypothetical protein
MHFFSYNHELLVATGEMQRLFGDMVIKNVNPDGAHKFIAIPAIFSQSSRILKSILNPDANPVRLPVISIERKDIMVDLTRNTEINYDIQLRNSNTDTRMNPNLKPPIPVNITYDVHFYSKHPTELDMMLSNFIPFFNKDVFVKTPHPKIEGRFLSHQIVWNGSIVPEWHAELQNIQDDIINATTSFTYKTELWGGDEKVKSDNSGKVLVIDLTLSNSTSDIYDKYDSSKNENNVGGFYAVPYSQSFNSYFEMLLASEIKNPIYDGWCNSYYNALLNEAIVNNDLASAKTQIAAGANIQKYSYWPYAYAEKHAYTELASYLKENGALIRNVNDSDTLHVADLPAV